MQPGSGDYQSPAGFHPALQITNTIESDGGLRAVQTDNRKFRDVPFGAVPRPLRDSIGPGLRHGAVTAGDLYRLEIDGPRNPLNTGFARQEAGCPYDPVDCVGAWVYPDRSVQIEPVRSRIEQNEPAPVARAKVKSPLRPIREPARAGRRAWCAAWSRFRRTTRHLRSDSHANRFYCFCEPQSIVRFRRKCSPESRRCRVCRPSSPPASSVRSVRASFNIAQCGDLRVRGRRRVSSSRALPRQTGSAICGDQEVDSSKRFMGQSFRRPSGLPRQEETRPTPPVRLTLTNQKPGRPRCQAGRRIRGRSAYRYFAHQDVAMAAMAACRTQNSSMRSCVPRNHAAVRLRAILQGSRAL